MLKIRPKTALKDKIRRKIENKNKNIQINENRQNKRQAMRGCVMLYVPTCVLTVIFLAFRARYRISSRDISGYLWPIISQPTLSDANSLLLFSKAD